MDLKAKHMVLLMVIALALVRAAAADDQNQIALPGCSDTCGNIKIPYPFGTGMSSSLHQNCSLEDKFNLTCNSTTSKLYRNNIEVLNISVEGQMEMSFYVSKLCKNDTDEANDPFLETPSYTISSNENKFMTVGYDNFGYLNSIYEGYTYSTGCLTRSYGHDLPMLKQKINGTCTGLGCCQVDIPPGMKNITLQVYQFSNSSKPTAVANYCGYAFVAKRGSYNFSIDHLQKLPNETFPLVVDWTVGNLTCEDAQGRHDYACKNNSICEDMDYGYRCICKQGYQGNPYLPHGCTDVDECKTDTHSCISELNCFNTPGNHTCFCPKGHSGDGTKGVGCHQEEILIKIVIGSSAGVLVLFMVTSWIYLIHQRRKLIKLKEKFFRQNGGQILQQHLSTMKKSSQTFQIFTEEKLKKATNNYDESLIIGSGGSGTVFKGLLADNRVVAIKKSRVIDQSQIKPFINEVVLLSQINHRNVVKLLGCCLETEVPTLVYEYVDNGTLFDYLFNEKNKASGNEDVSWKTRLRIAAEAAGALSYLHSAASIPIIHRDVKSANILLDHAYNAKVSDFGASRLVPLDQAELPTVVQGTMGYLDPESVQTGQLTEKSDVYSFGVVLVELLTRQKAFVNERPEEKRNIAVHFLCCLNEECLFEVVEIGILNEGNKEEIKEVAVLASKCLCLKGEERPSMKEVAMELEGLRVMDKHSWVNNAEVNLEETQKLLHEANSIFEHGDSSSHQNAGYDSLRDLELIVLDDGR